MALCSDDSPGIDRRLDILDREPVLLHFVLGVAGQLILTKSNFASEVSDSRTHARFLTSMCPGSKTLVSEGDCCIVLGVRQGPWWAALRFAPSTLLA